MFRSFKPFRVCTLAAALSLTGANTLTAATYSILNGEGFEAPAYSTTYNGTGSLEGQFASIDGNLGSERWAKSTVASPSTAVVQDSVAKDGSQSVRVDKVAGPDTFWGIQQSGFPDPGLPYVCIEWDMLVEPTMSAPGGNGEEPFGPYFGVSAFNSETIQKRLGYLVVDSENGRVLYGDSASDMFEYTDTTVTLGEWNKYQLILDYNTNTYSATVNGVLAMTGADIPEPFVDGPSTLFTDANISAFSAADTPYYSGLTGTAYFDNFSIIETDISKPVPEPTSFALLAMGLGLAAYRRRG